MSVSELKKEIKMLKRFIDTTVRKNACKLGYYEEVYFEGNKKRRDKIICSDNTANREWLAGGQKGDENYDDEDYLGSLRCYEVEDRTLEIITKIYVLSTVGLSKDEIVKNLKKIYNEDEINNAISFLKNNNLIEECFCIPHKNEVIMEISPRDICNTGKESKKFYTAKLYYNQNIAKIGLKEPKIHLSYKIFNEPYYFYISSNPLCFEQIPKSGEWDVELLSTSSLQQWIHFNILDEFMPETCVIENDLWLELESPEGEVFEEEIVHKDKEIIKEKLLKRLLKRIKLFGGKNIVVKSGIPLKLKYTLCKEFVLPITIAPCYIFSEKYNYSPCEVIQKNDKIWRLYVISEFAAAIRKRKKGEKDDYFFIDDESEDFDDFVIEDRKIYTFPCEFKRKFINYVAKKLKRVGAKIKVINKKFE